MRLARTLHPVKLLAAVVVAVLLSLGLSVGAVSAAVTGSGYHKPKPTIVLVHGAWADSSSWNGEISRLLHDGYPVVAAPNPLRGLASDSDYLSAFLQTITGPVILVGHSYGGAVITSAATGNPNIKAMVYVDAFAPDTGESIAQLGGADSFLAPAGTDPTSVFRLVPYPGAPAGAIDTYILTNLYITKFANGIPRAQAAVLAASQSPTSTEVFQPLLGAPAWKTIPTYYVLGTRDNAITPDAQAAMALRMHAKVTKIRAGHLGLISDPGAVTAVIEAAARAHS